MIVRLLTLTLLSCSTWLTAQTAGFNADFRFAEGVYLSHAALLANQPDLGWEAIGGEMVQLPEDFRVQIAGYRYNDERLDPGLVPYAISLDGTPYFFRRHDAARGFHEFTGLRIAGALSTMRYDTTVTERRLMKAYNPANGRPFREAYVDRERTMALEKVLHLRSGALLPLSKKTLLRLCADDAEIVTALRDVAPDDLEMLRRAVRLYDDRHPLPLPLAP